ncbi:TIGR04282 family arsenosugar biosynthesis glycosyltransferase [Seongchinamella unica]|nr:TIGR04282 family arsenosugar biosynthesis glycosyltransferase [Seongchinamella unica]
MEAVSVGDVLLIQFAREPVPGRVKTRMIPALAPAEACHLHRELVLWTARKLTSAGLGRVELAVAGNTASPLFRQCERLGVRAVRRQQGGDLGQRMCHALAAGLQTHNKVILVGSDCPQIDRDYLASAIDALDGRDVVLGPATDGGYVLIGVRQVDVRWFAGVKWGTAGVFAETVARFERTGAGWQPLAELQDIDRPEDLALWRALVELEA